ncbi:MAG: hypothetical protein ACRDPI_02575, partial [Nocardioidaceae bacterium]
LRRVGEARRVLRTPLLCVVLLTFLGEVAYAVSDFQGYPDLFPLLPYGALGFGVTTALLLKVVPTTVEAMLAAVLVLALGVLSGWTGQQVGTDPSVGALWLQRADACALERVNVPGSPIYSLGTPVPLVLTHRANPDRFILLDGGVARWKLTHTTGGLTGWKREIRAAHPSTIVFLTFRGEPVNKLIRWLREVGYRQRYLGEWVVWVGPRAIARAHQQGVRLSETQTPVATRLDGTPVPVRHCG